MNSKYSNILTIILIVIIVLIISILGFLGYKYYTNVVLKNNAEDFVESFVGDTEKNNNKDKEDNTDNDTNSDWSSGVQEGDSTASDYNPSANAPKYQGFYISGTIEIPAINIKYPVIAQYEYSKSSLEKSVVEIYGPGLNQEGNTTIAGHNYRNGTFFSNNKKLNIGDKIYITDLTGKRLSYTIYDKYEVSDTESAFMTRDTQGAIEISLSTCTDDVSARLIILAKADV